MEAVLEIQDSKASFVMELLGNFSFVKIHSFTDSSRKTNEVKKDTKEDFFAEVRGIWADRDIDGTTLRNQAWGIEE